MAGGGLTAQEMTETLYVPNPDKVNLVFNRSASRDTTPANDSSWSNDPSAPFSPSSGIYAQANPSDATADKYTIELGKAYEVGALEFVFGRYTNNYIPATFNLYASATDDANLMVPANLVATQATPGLINSDRTPNTDGAGWFIYQQIRYNLPAAQTVYKFGVEVTSWQAIGAGSDTRGFLLAASANPSAAPLGFDGEIGLFNNTWNPGGTITASSTAGGDITLTPVYGTDDWADPRWWGNYAGGGIDGGLDVTIHLPDYYKLDGVRWAAGQHSNWPVNYRVFAASSETTPGAGDWTPVTAALTFAGGNQGTLVPFDTPFVGNWVQIRAASGTSAIWENTNWQVYGSLSIPEPASLSLLGLAAAALARRSRKA